MLTIWWCPCVESSLVLLEEGVCYDQCVLLAKLYYSLPCFIPYSKAKFAFTPGVSWLPTFASQSPTMKRTSFLGVSSERPVGLHRTAQLQLLQRPVFTLHETILCLHFSRLFALSVAVIARVSSSSFLLSSKPCEFGPFQIQEQRITALSPKSPSI